jgi:hypothetical protein
MDGAPGSLNVTNDSTIVFEFQCSVWEGGKPQRKAKLQAIAVVCNGYIDPKTYFSTLYGTIYLRSASLPMRKDLTFLMKVDAALR